MTKKVKFDDELIKPEVKPLKVKKEEVKKGSVSVFDKNGAFIREYSSEFFGSDYKKIAEDFAGKEPGRSIK